MVKSSAVQSWGPGATSGSWHAGGKPGDFGFKCDFCGDASHRSCDCPGRFRKMLEKAVAGLMRVCGERVARSRCEEAMAGAVAKQRRWQEQRGCTQVASVQEQWQQARAKCGGRGEVMVVAVAGGKGAVVGGKGQGAGKGGDGGAVVDEWKEWIDGEEKKKKEAVRRKERKKKKREKIEEWKREGMNELRAEMNELKREMNDEMERSMKEGEDREKERWVEFDLKMKKWNETIERIEGGVVEKDENVKDRERLREMWEMRLERLEDVVKERLSTESEGEVGKRGEKGRTRGEEEKRRQAEEAQRVAEDAAAEAQRRKVEVEEEERRADAERERKRKVAEERRKREKVQADVATVQSGRKGGKGKGESAEYRQAPDGRWYTDQQFWQFYGGSEEGRRMWENAQQW